MSKLWRNLLFVSVISFGLADREGIGKRTVDFFEGNQVYLNKKDRFIKFDTKDNELEIELGVSIPVVKIPLAPATGKHAVEEDSRITVNAPGLVVGGALVLATFFIVPLLFSTKNYSDLRIGRSVSEEEGYANVMNYVRKSIHENFPNSSACLKTLICWSAGKSKDGGEGGIDNWMESVLRTKWVEQLVNETFIEEAVSSGRSGLDCRKKYRDCQILEKLTVK